MKKLNYRNYFFLEVLLGMALGTGHLTSLRFFGKVGFSEILFLLLILILSIYHIKSLLTFSRNIESLIRIYLFTSIFFVTPIVTAAVFWLTDYNSSPVHIISFAMSITLVFLLIEARRDGFNFKNATLWFFIIYISIHFITYFIYPIENVRYSYVYTGGANNPNQIVFYSQSLSLMLAVFYKKYALFFLPVILLLTLEVNSDAYLLSLQLAAVFYLFLTFFYVNKFSIRKNILLYLPFILVVSFILLFNYSDEIIGLWKMAGGQVRGTLFLNAIDVIKSSPIIGYGVGSFSGKTILFEGTEAHSNIFDLSMQFGIFFTFIIYFIMFKAIFIAVNRKEYFVASFMLAFIITGLFHYTARHFIFWMEFSMFYYYVFYSKNKA